MSFYYSIGADERYVTPSIPNPPSGLVFSNQTSGTIQLNWIDMSSNESAFNIYESSGVSQPSSATYIKGVGVTGHISSGLIQSTTYHYWITASGASGESSPISGSTSTTAFVPSGNFFNVWSSTGSSDWHTGANWSLGHIPAENEIAMFNATSISGVTATGVISCGTVIMSGTYTGAVNFQQNITTSGSMTYDGTGTLAFSSGVVATAGGDFHIGTGVGTVTATTADLVLTGTGNLDLDKSVVFRNLTTATTTNTGSVTTAGWSNILTVGVGTLTLTTQLAGTIVNQTDPIVVNGTITGTNSLVLLVSNTSDLTLNIPAITIGGTSTFKIHRYTGATATLTINQTGDWLTGTSISIHNYPNGTYIWNTNGYSLTTATLGWGSNLAGSLSYANFSSSVVNITTISNESFTFGTSVFNLESSVWYVSSHWSPHSSWTINKGTSHLIFNGAANSTITPTTSGFYNLSVIKTSNTYTATLAANLSCNELDVVSGNFTVSASDYSITSVSGIFFDSTGTVRLADATVTGDGDFHIGSAVGAVTFSSCDITLAGNGNFDTDKAGMTFSTVSFTGDGKTVNVTGLQNFTTGRLFLEPGVTVILLAGGTWNITSYVDGDWDGLLTKHVSIQSSVPGTYTNFVNPAGMTVQYIEVQDSVATEEIIVNSGVDNGHNINWLFYYVPVGFSGNFGQYINNGKQVTFSTSGVPEWNVHQIGKLAYNAPSGLLYIGLDSYWANIPVAATMIVAETNTNALASGIAPGTFYRTSTGFVRMVY